MDEGSLGIHEIEFVIDSGEDLSDGSGVGDHAACSHDLGEITTAIAEVFSRIDHKFDLMYAKRA